MNFVWDIFKVPLFSTLGATVIIKEIDPNYVGYGFLIIFIGLIVRFITVLLVTW